MEVEGNYFEGKTQRVRDGEEGKLDVQERLGFKILDALVQHPLKEVPEEEGQLSGIETVAGGDQTAYIHFKNGIGVIEIVLPERMDKTRHVLASAFGGGRTRMRDLMVKNGFNSVSITQGGTTQELFNETFKRVGLTESIRGKLRRFGIKPRAGDQRAAIGQEPFSEKSTPVQLNDIFTAIARGNKVTVSDTMAPFRERINEVLKGAKYVVLKEWTEPDPFGEKKKGISYKKYGPANAMMTDVEAA